jgi:ADP-ribose pyrophosphatase YjhB (NUDIX family)
MPSSINNHGPIKGLEIKVGALVMAGDEILLIKEKGEPGSKYRWNLVKGSFDPKQDRSLFDTAIRECQEEINTKVKIKNLINIIYYRQKDKIRVQFNFLCQGKIKKATLSSQSEQSLRGEDISEIRLFSKNQLARIKKQEFIDERGHLVVNDFLRGKLQDISLVREIINL